jgi:hypothetical protein
VKFVLVVQINEGSISGSSSIFNYFSRTIKVSVLISEERDEAVST